MKTGYIKINNEGQIEAQLIDGTVWLTAYEIADLFDVFTGTIRGSLQTIFKSKIIWKEEVSKIHHYTDKKGNERQTVFYNLKAILFISYRITSPNAAIFRDWVNNSLRKKLQQEETQRISRLCHLSTSVKNLYLA